MCARSAANTFWRRSAARSSRVFTALWTWRWSASIRGRTVRRCWRSCAAFSVFWTALSLAWQNLYIRIFVRPTAAILAMAPGIIRTYAVSFLLLPLNIFSTHYFQAILKPGAAFFVSVARGLVISGALILLLPEVLGPAAIWWAMPVTELLVACCAVSAMRRATRALPSC